MRRYGLSFVIGTMYNVGIQARKMEKQSEIYQIVYFYLTFSSRIGFIIGANRNKNKNPRKQEDTFDYLFSWGFGFSVSPDDNLNLCQKG